LPGDEGLTRQVSGTGAAYFGIFGREFDAISTILVECGSAEIMELFVDFYCEAVTGEVQAAFDMADRIVGILPSALAVSWRQVSRISKCLLAALSKEFLELAADARWFHRLLDFIQSVYSVQRSQLVLQGLDLSDFFNLLTRLTDFVSDCSAGSNLLTVAGQISQSGQHYNEFGRLLTRLYRKDVIDLETLLATIRQGKTDTDYRPLLILLSQTKDAATVTRILDWVSRKRAEGFVSRISGCVWDDSYNIGNLVRTFPEETLFRFLIDDSAGVRNSALDIGRGLVKELPPHVVGSPVTGISSTDHEALVSLVLGQMAHLKKLDLGAFSRPAEPGSLARTRGRYHFYLKFFKWTVRCLGYFDAEVFVAVLDFYRRLLVVTHDCSDMAAAVGILALFPGFGEHFIECYDQLFTPPPSHDYILTAFKKFLPFFCAPQAVDVFKYIFEHPSLPHIIERFPGVIRVGFLDRLFESAQCHIGLSLRIFESGFSLADHNTRSVYVRLLKGIAARLPADVLDSLFCFVISTFSQLPDGSCISEYIYAFELLTMLISEGVPLEIEFDYKGILNYARLHGDRHLEQPLAEFVAWFCRTRPESYRNELLDYVQDSYLSYARSYWPQAVLVTVGVRLAVAGSDRLVRVFEIVAGDGQMRIHFFDELMTILREQAVVPEWAKQFLNEVLSRKIKEGRMFVERILRELDEEEAADAFLKVVAESTFAGAEDWQVVTMFFTQLPRMADVLRDLLPITERVASPDLDVADAMDIIFGKS
jgi:hypothetical protein